MTEPTRKTLRILPGQWRPQYTAEQIAWVSPGWPSEDHIWLDYPEAVFVGDRLLYLSHISERFPSEYPHLPREPWEEIDEGIRVQRTLPNGLAFTGSLRRADERAVAMELTFTNGGDEPLTDIKLQTCAYLRAISELADFTHGNVFVRCGERGWMTLDRASECPALEGGTRLGWREGPTVADIPVIVCTSDSGDRGVAMTWYEHTYSLIGNPDHPCMHADPFVGDLAPGGTATLRGAMVFFGTEPDELDYHRDIAVYRGA